MKSTTNTNNTFTFQKTIRRHRFRCLAATGGIALTSLSAAFAQPGYFVTELPTPTGYETTVPYQINDQGFVVGASNRGDQQVATVWKAGTVQVLGMLKDGTYSIANAINSKGIVAGEGDDGDGRPLGWVTSAGKPVNFFSNNGGNTRPVAINEGWRNRRLLHQRFLFDVAGRHLEGRCQGCS